MKPEGRICRSTMVTSKRTGPVQQL